MLATISLVLAEDSEAEAGGKAVSVPGSQPSLSLSSLS